MAYDLGNFYHKNGKQHIRNVVFDDSVSLFGTTAPSSTTAADYVGQVYVDEVGQVAYVCVSIDLATGTYVWKPASYSSYYITKNANGDAFATYAELESATTFYSGGVEKEPETNDYCIIIADVTHADEVSGYSSFTTTSPYVGYYVLYNNISTLVTSSNKDSVGITPGTTVAYHNIPTTRYTYQGTQWEFQFIINETAFTESQLAAINSGITSVLVAKMETTDNKVTSLSAQSTDTQYPSAKCVYDIIGDVETLLTTLNSGGGV